MQNEPDYDAYVMDGPQYDLPAEAIECKQCGEVVSVEGITEVQLELNTCNDICAYREIKDLRAALAAASTPRGESAQLWEQLNGLQRRAS